MPITLTRAEHHELLLMANAARAEIIAGLWAYSVGEERIALLRRVLDRALPEGRP